MPNAVISGMEPTAQFDTGQVSVTSTAVQIVPANPARSAVTIINNGTTAVYIGASSGVTTATGAELVGTAGMQITLPTTAAVYGIVASTAQVVSFIELFN